MPWRLIIMDMTNIWHLSLQLMIAIPYKEHLFGEGFEARIYWECVLKPLVLWTPMRIPTNLVIIPQAFPIPSSSMGTWWKPCFPRNIQNEMPIPFSKHQFLKSSGLRASNSSYKMECWFRPYIWEASCAPPQSL